MDHNQEKWGDLAMSCLQIQKIARIKYLTNVVARLGKENVAVQLMRSVSVAPGTNSADLWMTSQADYVTDMLSFFGWE